MKQYKTYVFCCRDVEMLKDLEAVWLRLFVNVFLLVGFILGLHFTWHCLQKAAKQTSIAGSITSFTMLSKRVSSI